MLCQTSKEWIAPSEFLGLVDEFLHICADWKPLNPVSIGDVMTTIKTAAKDVGLDLVDPKIVPANTKRPRFHPTEWYFLSTGQTLRNARDDHQNHQIDNEQSSFDIVLRHGRLVADLFMYICPGSVGRLEWRVGVFSWLSADDLTELCSYNDQYEGWPYDVDEHAEGLFSWLAGMPNLNDTILSLEPL